MESTGQAKAEAQSRAEASKIEGEASVQQAKLKSEATSIEAVSLPNTFPLLVGHQVVKLLVLLCRAFIFV